MPGASSDTSSLITVDTPENEQLPRASNEAEPAVNENRETHNVGNVDSDHFVAPVSDESLDAPITDIHAESEAFLQNSSSSEATETPGSHDTVTPSVNPSPLVQRSLFKRIFSRYVWL
jgi:hypothetical protein